MSSPFNPLTPSLGLPGPSGNTPYMNLGASPLGALGALGSPASPWFQLAPGSAQSMGMSGAPHSLLAGFGLTPGASVPGLPGMPGMGGGMSGMSGGMGMGMGMGGMGGGGMGGGGMGGQGGQGGPAVGLLAPPTHTVPASTDLDDALRVFPEIARRVERAEQLRAECASLEARVFRDGSDGMDARIEGVQLECESDACRRARGPRRIR